MIWIPFFWIGVAVLNYDTAAAIPFTTEGPQTTVNLPSALIGPKECLEGPSYWCQNFTTAKHCQANHHCIRTVWEHQQLPPDNNHICDVCKNAVAQARDELQSNETQQNIKLVLEGSCLILVPIKVLAHECVKMIDDVIPQLIEALSSMMNPQMVCANAGLCNSRRIAQLIAEYKPKPVLDCGNCTAVAGMAERNFRNSNRDHVLNSMLELCGGLGSFSDGCAAAVIVHFNSLYESLNSHFTSEGVCHLAGVCQQKYHNHSKTAEVKAVVPLKDDMPCELCEQLVQHLRDILVANTTEKEFEQVLLGLCGTTKSFKKQCVNLVETYYPVIYGFLTEELDAKVLCTQIGICPKSLSAITPLYPLLPAHVTETLQKDTSGLHRVTLSSSGISVHSGFHSLPLDDLVLLPQDKNLCQMCEYFLHFLQNELTDPVNEQIIIKKAEKACDGLPDKFAPTCHTFMETYARAVIALLAQDIDPSQVCPKIGVCPGVSNSILGCQSCKVTAYNLIDRVGSNKSESNIQKELLTLCLTLPYEESRECSRLLVSHQEDLADMITAEFTTDEMCFFMKYCTVKSSSTSIGGDTETNEIPNTLEDEHKDSEICVLCEFIMKEIEETLEKNSTESTIRNVVENICHVMPHTVKSKCVTFVDQYIDLIVTLLAESIQPKQICQAIEVCPDFVGLEYVRKTVSKCVVCESLMGAMQGVIEDADVERDINRQLEMACFKLPRPMRRECEDVVRQLAPQIETILGELPLGPLVCRRLQLCGHSQSVDLVAADRCSEGQSYWCLSTVNAAVCQKIDHCQKNVWLGDKPNKKKLHTKKFMF